MLTFKIKPHSLHIYWNKSCDNLPRFHYAVASIPPDIVIVLNNIPSHGSWHEFLEWLPGKLEQAMWAGVWSESQSGQVTHKKNQVVRTPHTPPQHCSVQLQRVHALLTSFLQNSAKDATRHMEFTPSSVYPVRVGLFTPDLLIRTQTTGLNNSGTI